MSLCGFVGAAATQRVLNIALDVSAAGLLHKASCSCVLVGGQLSKPLHTQVAGITMQAMSCGNAMGILQPFSCRRVSPAACRRPRPPCTAHRYKQYLHACTTSLMLKLHVSTCS